MIPEHAAHQAITLAERGWNLSEIARHLGHDRKTIRIYLNGSRISSSCRRRWHTPMILSRIPGIWKLRLSY